MGVLLEAFVVPRSPSSFSVNAFYKIPRERRRRKTERRKVKSGSKCKKIMGQEGGTARKGRGDLGGEDDKR